ncbi:putative cyclic nucleotide phosphodiesterase [Actinoplanes missouriensis 431]|uniref:Putative cyclic nucleotide phosphodiesterase n=1 Tax=Actinoplanes missouriensis (strain ATCC 14538 / DSM 43046 / CBS 188.64 / JCM 3121 / NBRC 102363 / NCIMB 12654 / NRRL B-3342 / UNCC 431) TaxID=512565 RepID=I0H1X8_ACTM4|nr:metallophosphoesterase [Actinoplanes missouriensis]BAL87015.1 putative cyclic nucleotide phosphodiesterase [Actinoplanes missouriensis 431]
MSGRPVVVAHLSDLHLGAHDRAAVESIADDVTRAGPALTVVTGDSTMRARTGEFRRARHLLDRLPGPLLTVTGNHDVPLVSWRRVLRPYHRYRTWMGTDLDPDRTAPGLVALGLQSMPRWRWKNGRVSARQAALVTRVLGGAPAGDLRLLALHHPPLVTGPDRLIGRARLLDAIRAARVDLVLAGHTHVPDVRVPWPGGPVFVVAGTSVSRRTRHEIGCSWSLISVHEGEVVVQERYLVDDGWTTGRVVTVPRPGS